MPKPTLVVECDWNADGDFADTGETITAYVMRMSIHRGAASKLERMAALGECTIELKNSDKRFSPGYAAGALYPNVKASRHLRVRSTAPVAATLFDGRIAEIVPTPNAKGARTCTITAYDDLDRLSRNDVNVALQVNRRSDQLISTVVAAVYTPAATDYGVGDDTYPYAGDTWFFRADDGGNLQNDYSIQGNALDAVRSIVNSEFGRFWIARDGTPTFRARSSFFSAVSSAATFSDSMKGLQVRYASDSILNKVTVTAYPRTIGSTVEVLWKLDKADSFAPGEARQYRAAFTDPNNPDIRIGGNNVVTPVANTDYKLNSQADGAGDNLSASLTISSFTVYANYAEFTATNTSTRTGYLVRAQVRGQKLTQFNPAVQKSSDSASQTEFDIRRADFDQPLQDSALKAQDLADYLIYDGKDQHEEVTGLVVSNRTDALLTQQLTRVLGELITVSETQTGLSGLKYFIIGEHHEFSEGGNHVETTWDLERGRVGEFWILGVAGYSELGTTTRLGF